MKIFIPLFITILLFTAASVIKTGQLCGIAKDKNTGEAVAFAAIKVSKNDLFVKGVISDHDGKYALDLEPGIYSVECSFLGYSTIKYDAVQIFEDKKTTLDIDFIPSTAILSEVVVSSPKMETRRMESTSSGMVLTSDEVVIRGSRKTKSAATTSSVTAPKPSKSKDYDKSPAKPAMAESTKYKHDLNPDILYEPASTHDAISGKLAPATPPNETQKAGQLTAGEWNDLQNWGNHWNDLLADGEIEVYENMYHFYPKNRYAAILQNDENFPIADVKVRLVDEKGQNIWQTRTDNTGKAELWSGLFDTLKLNSAFVEAEIKGKYQRLGAAKPIEQGINFFKIAADCKSPNQLDIVWAVDATGSMSDEIDFLKSEVLDVIGRVKQQNTKLAVRMGSVFYRDKGDEYLTRNSPLTADIKSTVNFIQNQAAGGGGDYPEAVHTALEEAIEKMAWSEKAIARICFLVLDASPHQEPEVIASLQKSIKLAAEKGIRIVPLSASGIQKDTEFLMKFFGLALMERICF
jgi:CarboxypepD_reg-like domain/von Willebrand factor type A domain